MMASIPNMRSTPLPVPATKAAPAGDPAGGFTALLPVVPEQAPATPGQPSLVAPPVLSPVPAEPFENGVPQIPAPEGSDDSADGEGQDDGAAPAKAEAVKADAESPQVVVIPFIQQPPAVPVPQVAAAPTPAETPPTTPDVAAAAVARLPVAPAGKGKQAAPAPDAPDTPTAGDAEADAIGLESAVKELLQRKPGTTKQVAASPKPAPTHPATSDKTPVKDAPQPVQAQAQASAAATAIQVAAPLPSAEPPQPALSPTPASPAPTVVEKAAAVDGTSTADLAVERKLDLSRDGQWLDRLARDIARAASDDSPLRFRLHPQTLGHLQVELQQGDRGTAVRMTVDTEAARQILTDAQPRLTAEGRAQGVRIAETHVDLSGSGRQAPGDQRRQDEARPTPFIRTATGADAAAVTARTSRRARLDRYA